MKYRVIWFLAIFNYCYSSENIIESNAIGGNVDKAFFLKANILSFVLASTTTFLLGVFFWKGKSK